MGELPSERRIDNSMAVTIDLFILFSKNLKSK